MDDVGVVSCWGLAGDYFAFDDQIAGGRQPTPLGGNERFQTVSIAIAHGCALGSDGRAFRWSENSSGQLGDGSTVSCKLPTNSTPAAARPGRWKRRPDK